MIEIDESKMTPIVKIIDIIKRLLCLLLPICFAFGGYFLSPLLWQLFSKSVQTPEYFKFLCSFIFLLLPSSFIFIYTRKLNPTIKITLKNSDDLESKKPSELANTNTEGL